jgi:hypothetical protein
MRATANNDNSLIIIMTYSSYSAKAPDYPSKVFIEGSTFVKDLSKYVRAVTR